MKTDRITELLNLNDEQQNILKEKSFIAVEAGAGSGKTRSIVAKYLSILEQGRAGVDEIVAITFTKNAATELRKKIRNAIEEYIEKFPETGNINRNSLRRLSSAPVSTIHGFCSEILKKNPLESGIPINFSIMDDSERKSFYSENLFSFLHERCSASDTLILKLLEYENYNYSVLTETIEYILSRASNLHVEPPFRHYSCNKPTDFDENFTVDESSALRLSELVPGRSKNKIKRVYTYCRRVNASSSVAEKITNLIRAHAELNSEYKRLPEARYLRNKLRNEFEAIVENFNLYLSCLYLQASHEAYSYLSGKKTELNQFEHEDLIRFAYRTIKHNSKLRDYYRHKYKYIIIDEFQDTDRLQYDLIRALVEGSDTGLVVVGDIKQSIYSFRGGDPEIFQSILGREQDSTLQLKSNYRSTGKLIGIYNEFFSGFFQHPYTEMKFEGDLCGTESDLEVIRVDGHNTSEIVSAEADIVAAKVDELLMDDDYRHIALLFRNSTHTGVYENALKKRKIDFKSQFVPSFFDSQEVRDLVSMLRFFRNPHDTIAEASVMRSVFLGADDYTLFRFYGKRVDSQTDINRIEDYKAYLLGKRKELYSGNFIAVVDFIIENLGFSSAVYALPGGNEKCRNIINFRTICERLAKKGLGIGEVISYFDDSRKNNISGISDSYLQDNDKRVELLTVHGAKGLEYDAVILCNCEYPKRSLSGERILGDAQSGFLTRYRDSDYGNWKELKEKTEIKLNEEEKRLLYVAMTRARKKLLISVSRPQKRQNVNSFAGLITCSMSSGSADAGKVEFCGSSVPEYSSPDRNDYPVNGLFTETRHEEETVKEIDMKMIEKMYTLEDYEIPDNHFFAENVLTASMPSDNTIEAGSLMHRFLEIWDFTSGKTDTSINFVLNEFFLKGDLYCDQLHSLASNFRDSRLYEIINSSMEIYREYGFVINTDEGIKRGRIDLIVRDEKDLLLFDYKFTSTSEMSQYLPQMEMYSFAAEKKFGVAPTGRYIVTIPEVKLHKV